MLFFSNLVLACRFVASFHIHQTHFLGLPVGFYVVRFRVRVL